MTLAAGSPPGLLARTIKARRLLHAARRERRRGRHAGAAELYEAALELRPGDHRLRIQAGHMRKEARQMDRAEAHYLAALRAMPDDAELALQLGHFYKIANRYDDMLGHYDRAAMLRPGWATAAVELEAVAGERAWTPFGDLFPEQLGPAAGKPEAEGREAIACLAPRIVPRTAEQLVQRYGEQVRIDRLGRHEAGYWGTRRTLRGIEAVRGICISAVPIVELRLLLDGIEFHRVPVGEGFPLHMAEAATPLRKYVFNEWLDMSGHARGLHAFEVRLIDAGGHSRSEHDRVVVADPAREADWPDSDALVEPLPGDSRPIEDQIRSRPSMVRDARRTRFPDGLRNVLVLRTDQLGDLISSIPALRRLREIAPNARIVGLLTTANADIARTLALFDEIIVVDFPDDPVQRIRLMPLAEQEALRIRLAAYRFDAAIDLAQSTVSRDLLPLSGAPFLYGTGGGDWPWLSADTVFHTHDRWNGLDTTPHSTIATALIETFGAIARNDLPIIRRDELTRAMLAPLGITADERFILLHAGARVAFSRWPGFGELAAALLARTPRRVVLVSDDADFAGTLPPVLRDDPRFLFIGRRLPFDQFDALVSFADAVVGNDSGPKHLAALRGVPVVTLFTARINWAEWGQENVGLIVSRRVPCAGCLIFHEAEECGKQFACIRDIRTDEVLDAVLRLL